MVLLFLKVPTHFLLLTSCTWGGYYNMWPQINNIVISPKYTSFILVTSKYDNLVIRSHTHSVLKCEIFTKYCLKKLKSKLEKTLGKSRIRYLSKKLFLYIFFKLYVTLTCHDLDLFVFRLMQTPMMMMKKKTKMILLVLATKTIWYPSLPLLTRILNLENLPMMI